MALDFGLSSSRGIGPERGGRAFQGDNYLVAAGGRMTWRHGDGERRAEAQGPGELFAVASSEGEGEQDLGASTAVQLLGRLFQGSPPEDPEKALRSYLLKGHERMHAHAAERGPVRVGASLTGAWFLGARVSWVQVGDSRLSLLRGGRMIRLTADHTLDEFALREGKDSVRGGQRLAQALILGSLDLGDSRLRIDPGLDTGTMEIQDEDRYLLTTVGLHRYVDDASLAEVLRHTPSPQAASVALLERAIARGSRDNLTALVVRAISAPICEKAGVIS